MCSEKSIPNIASLLISTLNETVEDTNYHEEERLDIIDQLCEYLDYQDVLFRVTEELLSSGPHFGKYYDLIIPYFRSEEVFNAFVEYYSEFYNDWKNDVLLLNNAIRSEKNNGFYVMYGVLKKAFRNEETMIVPDSVHTIREDAFEGDIDMTITIIIPSSVKRIERDFCLYRKDFNIVYKGTKKEWNNIIDEDSKEWFDELQISFENEN